MFTVLPVRHGRCFSTSQETQSLVESMLSEPEGAGLCGQKPLPLVPDWSILMQMRMPNPCSLIVPKSTTRIDQNRATLIGQSCRGKSSDWMEKVSVLLGEILYKG